MESPEAPFQEGEAWIPNIGAKGRDRRLKHGIGWLVAGMAASVAFILLHPPLPAFGGLYVVFFMAALGYFQASQKTWIRRAAQGLREDEEERIAGRIQGAQLAAVRRRALGVIWRSALAALVLTGTAFLAAEPSFLPKPRE